MFLPWSYGHGAFDDVGFYAAPSPLQLFLIVLPVLTLLLLALPLVGKRRLGSFAKAVAWNTSAKTASIATLVTVAVAVASIAIELEGLVNVETGGWMALAGALVATVATPFLPDSPEPSLARVKTPRWVQIVGIAAMMAAVLFLAAFALNQTDAGTFLTFLTFLVAVSARCLRQFGVLALARDRGSQQQPGADAVGVRGRLRLPVHPERLGREHVDRHPGADLRGHRPGPEHRRRSGRPARPRLHRLPRRRRLHRGRCCRSRRSPPSTVNPPFLVVVLIAGTVASLLGLLIGAPTLRVSGDYLAIVTLAFGEIFRITMNNLDGNDGPNLTNGSNGISGHP